MVPGGGWRRLRGIRGFRGVQHLVHALCKLLCLLIGQLTPEGVSNQVPAVPANTQFLIVGHALEKKSTLFARQFAIHECRKLFTQKVTHRCIYSKSGSIRFVMASRALKILERTVPTGQSMA